jgi:hypothetical protein
LKVLGAKPPQAHKEILKMESLPFLAFLQGWAVNPLVCRPATFRATFALARRDLP